MDQKVARGGRGRDSLLVPEGREMAPCDPPTYPIDIPYGVLTNSTMHHLHTIKGLRKGHNARQLIPQPGGPIGLVCGWVRLRTISSAAVTKEQRDSLSIVAGGGLDMHQRTYQGR